LRVLGFKGLKAIEFGVMGLGVQWFGFVVEGYGLEVGFGAWV